MGGNVLYIKDEKITSEVRVIKQNLKDAGIKFKEVSISDHEKDKFSEHLNEKVSLFPILETNLGIYQGVFAINRYINDSKAKK